MRASRPLAGEGGERYRRHPYQPAGFPSPLAGEGGATAPGEGARSQETSPNRLHPPLPNPSPARGEGLQGYVRHHRPCRPSARGGWMRLTGRLGSSCTDTRLHFPTGTDRHQGLDTRAMRASRPLAGEGGERYRGHSYLPCLLPLSPCGRGWRTISPPSIPARWLPLSPRGRGWRDSAGRGGEVAGNFTQPAASPSPQPLPRKGEGLQGHVRHHRPCRPSARGEGLESGEESGRTSASHRRPNGSLGEPCSGHRVGLLAHGWTTGRFARRRRGIAEALAEGHRQGQESGIGRLIGRGNRPARKGGWRKGDGKREGHQTQAFASITAHPSTCAAFPFREPKKSGPKPAFFR